ncbi:hypothetical protein MMB232_02213 [Brevundimonas subvibrioides]
MRAIPFWLLVRDLTRHKDAPDMRVIARSALAFATVLAIAACEGSPEPAAAPVAAATPAAAEAPAPPQAAGGLAIEGEGLRLFSASGSARPVPFGTPQDVVIGLVAGMLGARETPEVTTNSECGEGPVQFASFSNGLKLAFQDEKFAGWFLDAAGLTTVDGVGVGTTRADLDGARTIEIDPESTLGIEFQAGDMGGFLTADGAAGTVESLYAGATCFFR